MSVRLDEEVRSRLNRQAQLASEPPASYAARLIDEGLRCASHPGITFRSTPTGGRLAALPDGPDVAEVVRVLQGLESRGQDRIAEAAAWLDLPERRVRIAVAYYAEFSDEIDRELAARADAGQRLQEQLEREQDLLD
jgi:hypothetical protein